MKYLGGSLLPNINTGCDHQLAAKTIVYRLTSDKPYYVEKLSAGFKVRVLGIQNVEEMRFLGFFIF